jgi:hypothetical protein
MGRIRVINIDSDQLSEKKKKLLAMLMLKYL